MVAMMNFMLRKYNLNKKKSITEKQNNKHGYLYRNLQYKHISSPSH